MNSRAMLAVMLASPTSFAAFPDSIGDAGGKSDLVAGTVFLILIGVLFFLFVLCLPGLIARGREVSTEQQGTVNLLAILGIFFGITWIVALILACVYPPVRRNRRSVAYLMRQDRVTDEDLARELGFAQEEEAVEEAQPVEVVNPVAKPVTVVTLDICENCGRSIGKLETPSVWKEHVVCGNCCKTLSNA